jgi:hypothetical protein
MLEIIKAIVKVVRSDAAPEESGVIGKCLKHCSGETIKATHEVIKARWNDEEENPQWRVASLAVRHKGKGVHKDLNNQQDLNNHQGVALQDLMSQFLSSILSNGCLTAQSRCMAPKHNSGCRQKTHHLHSQIQAFGITAHPRPETQGRQR